MLYGRDLMRWGHLLTHALAGSLLPAVGGHLKYHEGGEGERGWCLRDTKGVRPQLEGPGRKARLNVQLQCVLELGQIPFPHLLSPTPYPPPFHSTAEEAVLHVGCGGPGVCGLRPGGQEDPGASARDQTFAHS